MRAKLPRIEVAESHKKILIDEFRVSDQTVRNALKYFTNGDQPEKIRKRAKELLLTEAKKVQLETK